MKLAHGTREVRLVIGGESRIGLLPDEVTARVKSKAMRRALVGVVAGAAVVSAAGYGLASLVAADSRAALESAQARTSALIVKQADFAEVGQVENELKVATAARRIGASTEVDWAGYLAEIATTLPAGVSITTVSVEGATPLASYAASAVPLEGERVGTVSLTASSTGVLDVATWLDSLAGLRGFVDATPGTIAKDEAGYTVSVTMHFNSEVYANRFIEALDADADTMQESDPK